MHILQFIYGFANIAKMLTKLRGGESSLPMDSGSAGHLPNTKKGPLY
jgi:hypothetical protein